MHTVVPQQTKSNNTWAQGVFKNWLLCRNASKDPTIENFPVDILQTDYETSVVDQALAAFVLEAKRMDGNYYPGTRVFLDILITYLLFFMALVYNQNLCSLFILWPYSITYYFITFCHMFYFSSHVLSSGTFYPMQLIVYKKWVFFQIDVQLVTQCKLPTKQLHDLKWPAFGLAALMLAT